MNIPLANTANDMDNNPQSQQSTLYYSLVLTLKLAFKHQATPKLNRLSQEFGAKEREAKCLHLTIESNVDSFDR
jgi:hypothetical protein